MDRQEQVRDPAPRSTNRTVPVILDVPSIHRAACRPKLVPQFSLRGPEMEKLERHLPGMERSDVFFFVCVGAFGTAFLTML